MDHTPAAEVTAADICDTLGRKEMAARLERTVAAVSNAASDGAFPAGWFLVISQMCADKGIDCPSRLFRFLTPQVESEAPPQAGAA